MPWTEITRTHHDRSGLLYASDCRDDEGELIAPIVETRSKVGRPRTVDMREVWEAIFSTLRQLVVSGGYYLKISQLFPLYDTISIECTMMAHSPSSMNY